MALPARHDPQANDDIGRPRLDWPEPLALESIRVAYGPFAETESAIDAVRLHAQFLRALVEGEAERSSRLRVDLIACCAARHIGMEAIAAADHAVFSELSAIIRWRFRNSPRLQAQFIRNLHDALGRLTNRTEQTANAERQRRLRVPSAPRTLHKTVAFAG